MACVRANEWTRVCIVMCSPARSLGIAWLVCVYVACSPCSPASPLQIITVGAWIVLTNRKTMLAWVFTLVALLLLVISLLIPAYKNGAVQAGLCGSRALVLWCCFMGVITTLVDDESDNTPAVFLLLGWAVGVPLVLWALWCVWLQGRAPGVAMCTHADGWGRALMLACVAGEHGVVCLCPCPLNAVAR